MAQGEGFKHITVTPPEEEDEVIFAGVEAIDAEKADGEPSQSALSGNAAVGASGDGPSRSTPSGNAAVGAPGDGPSRSTPPVGAHSVRPASEASAGDPAAKGALRSAKSPKDSYRDPTLEDLQGAPMPLTQKIVIAAALVCIIGAVIYYFAFMG